MNLGHLVESELGYVFYFYHCVELMRDLLELTHKHGVSFIYHLSQRHSAVRVEHGI